MKVILSKQSNSHFKESELKHEKDAKRFKTDLGYLQFRNALSSYTSYTIVEVFKDDPNQIIKCTVPILNFENWDNTIFDIGLFFINRFKKTPQILTANQFTLNKMDLYLNDKLKKNGEEKPIPQLGRFECSRFSLNVCIDEGLADNYFCIIFDEQAEII